MLSLLATGFLAISAVHAAPTSFLKERQLGLPPLQQLTASSVNGSVTLVENSGICETTPGVTQYSGYVNQANDTQHFWFWFFAARNNVCATIYLKPRVHIY
jgi:carboxypeptidase D